MLTVLLFQAIPEASSLAMSDLLRVFAATLGVIVSAPILIAVLRALFFFGSLSAKVEQFGGNFEKLEEKMEKGLGDTNQRLQTFTEKCDRIFLDHEARISMIEGTERPA